MSTKYKILNSSKNTKILGECNGKLQIEVTCQFCNTTKIINIPIDEYIDFSEHNKPFLPSLTDNERLLLGEEWCGFCTPNSESQN